MVYLGRDRRCGSRHLQPHIVGKGVRLLSYLMLVRGHSKDMLQGLGSVCSVGCLQCRLS